jgi:hypothetical protein
MSWQSWSLLFLATILTSASAGQGATDGMSKADELPKVKVFLFDLVSLPERTQKQAQDRVASIFHKAGVEMEWAPCSKGEGQLTLFPDCTGFKEAASVLLRILRPAREKAETDAAGESMLSSRIVNVFWGHAQKESTRLNVPLDMLAEIIAHEVGHVFLGPNSHSPLRIMAAKWKPRDMIAISQGGYGFTRQQRELIQTELRRRQAQQTASGLPPIR